MPQSLAMNDATLSLDAERDALTERGLARLRAAYQPERLMPITLHHWLTVAFCACACALIRS